MSITSSEYEDFIASLVRNISSSGRNIEFLCSGAKCKLTGILGQPHQIDVAFIDKTFNPNRIVLIECKFKNPRYRIGPEVIKILAFNGSDIVQSNIYPNNCMLIVCSTSEFTSGAKRLAKALDIKMEKVGDMANYSFQYENFIQVGMTDSLHGSDSLSVSVKCPNGKPV